MEKFVLQNTLVTPAGIDTLTSMPMGDEVYPSLVDLLTKFQDIKKFASEIHTEIHLVKPMLKMLGFTYESKPKFFEDHVKDPDVALFSSEDERVRSSKLWGNREYYENVLSILVLKRYGRNLHEGITGFYLEFENRIPLYQVMYLLKKSATPWGILTNGRYWILIKRPVTFEQKLIEIDLEAALLSGEEKFARFFFNVFSLLGLKNTLPQLLEHEREILIKHLKDKKRSTRRAIGAFRKRLDIYPRIRAVYTELFPDDKLPATEAYMAHYGIEVESKPCHQRPSVLNEYDRSDICSYLFADTHAKSGFDVEEIITNRNTKYTKEDLLSLRILDMTPGFGNVTMQLLEGLAYLAFVLPYKERNTFIAEWEHEKTLKKYILDRNLYGIERSHICYDALQNMLNRRYGSQARHYRPGNPLIGMALKDIAALFDITKQGSLFGRNPKEVLDDFREMYRLYYSLSKKIKEDVKVREEIEAKLKIYSERIRDVMDATTATFFARDIDNKKVEDMVFSLEADESTWTIFRKKPWFIEARQLAARNNFFHMELEFPILLHNAYDFIFVQPALNYSWEDDLPLGDATKAFIKKGMPFLKQDGRFIVLLDEDSEALLSDLRKSKKYAVETKKGLLILTKRIA